MKSFSPDIIVEATRACDRQCRGCYAPNLLVSRDNAPKTTAQDGVFLSQSKLRTCLVELVGDSQKVAVTAIRGGEPTLHPDLSALITVAAEFSDAVYVETHGRWLDSVLPGSAMENVLDTCRDLNVILKISFDRMHGLSGVKLKDLLAKADAHGVPWVVAMTKTSQEIAEGLIATTPWLKSGTVIFQRKASKASELVRPSRGTITSTGKINGQITSKFSVSRPLSEINA